MFAQEPTSAHDWLKMGMAEYRAKRYTQAQAAFEKAVALSPEYANARLYLGSTHMVQWVPGENSPANQTHFQQAQEAFQHVLATDAYNKLALAYLASLEFNYAQGLGRNGTPDEKFAALERSRIWNKKRVEVDPNDPEPFYYLGVIGWSECFPSIQKQRIIDGLPPEDPGPLSHSPEKIELQATCGATVDQAIQDLKRAIELDPSQEDAMSYLNLSYRLKANMVDSKEDALQLVETAQDWANRSLETKRMKAQQTPKQDKPPGR
jgi:tetratricopeptide (TPR) repeat protein